MPLNDQERFELSQILDEMERRQKGRLIDSFFPDDGELRREFYSKHMQFFEEGAHHRERLFLAANRVGKSIVGSYESSTHLTGQYPEWWVGKKFDEPTRGWACGTSNVKTREICQEMLLGPINDMGTGMVPMDAIHGKPRRKAGVPDAIDTFEVKHISGGTSKLGFKSYESGREGFEGTAQHFIWLDEEPPLDVYTECVLRTMTTDGIIMATFTPLKGMSDVVLMFLKGGRLPQ